MDTPQTDAPSVMPLMKNCLSIAVPTPLILTANAGKLGSAWKVGSVVEPVDVRTCPAVPGAAVVTGLVPAPITTACAGMVATPVPPCGTSMTGKSAFTKLRKNGWRAPPVGGPANTRFGEMLAKSMVTVPGSDTV